IVAVSLAFLVGVWDEFMQAVGASERIFEVIDQQPLVTAPDRPIALPPRGEASVEFERVSFAYPSRPDVSVLRDISFSIEPGTTVAFVGPSGAGKSTIASLIPRFYDPQQGEVRYAGIPLTSLDPIALRSKIAIVQQDPQVFSVTIADNIRYGSIGASDQELIEAAKAAHIHEFVTSLPAGYQTLVGDRGVQLSGGQRQRIAIARAILKNPDFLILDEATSSLDSENEHLVQQALTKLMTGRTTLIIAHRLSTVQHADKVIVLHAGTIEQEGSHSSLVGTEGLYQTLVQHQLL
ncbi:MAG: ATP-binding cassette domain-containing protein, partial [Bdellovibrionales bacterium]|nr:ATP-binding cassette domain-containing protein [Bdellovibrionales bacterium]